MNQIRVYVSHSIRGKKGKDATLEDMEANNQKAIKFGKRLREQFPNIDFYIPGDHDEFVTIAYICGFLNETQILDVDCEIVQRCNFLIAYAPDNHISNGMQVEVNYAHTNNIPVVYIWDETDLCPIEIQLQNLIR